MLYPVMNETRSLIDLSGIWRVQVEKQNEAIDPAKPLKDPFLIAVPGSIDDQVIDETIRKHVGNFWYETEMMIPISLMDERKVLRFASVTHEAVVYINGIKAAHHIGGFTPFEIDIDSLVHAGKNDLKVCVSNILDESTLPCGFYQEKMADHR